MAQFTWEGDFASAAEWLPFGESMVFKLKRMSSGNIMRMNHQPTQDVLIMAQCNPDCVFIRASGGGYMESGFLDWGSLIYSMPETYQPATIRFNQFVSAHSGGSKASPGRCINASKSRGVVDGSRSKALGCKATVDELPIYNPYGDYLRTVYSKDPGFCSGDVLVKKKLAQAYCPPSVFTGKMRHFVQALYGTNREDYEGAVYTSGGELILHTGQYQKNREGEFVLNSLGERIPIKVNLSPYAAGGSSIIKVNWQDESGNAHSDWVLVTVGETVVARKMLRKYKPADEPVTDIPRDADMLEFYDLATLVPDTRERVIGDLSAITSTWSFKTYGWHFTTAGTHAVAAVHQEVEIAGKNMQGDDRTRTGWLCALAELSVSVGIEPGGNVIGYASASVSGGEQVFPSVQHYLYFPWHSTANAMFLVSMVPSDAYISSGEAVVYAYYNAKDELQQVKIKNSLWESTPDYFNTQLDSNSMSVVFGESSCWSQDSYATEGWLSKGAGYKYGGASMFTPSETLEGSSETFSVSQWRRVALGGSYGTTGYSYLFEKCGAVEPLPNPVLVTFTYYGNTINDTYRSTTNKANHVRSSRPFMVVPFNDASAVITGVLSRTDGSLDYASREIGNTGVLKLINGDWAKVTGSGFGGQIADNLPELKDENAVFVPSYQGSMTLHHYHGTQSIYSTGATGDLLSESALLNLGSPSDILTSPYYPYRITVTSSVNGAVWWSFQGPPIAGSIDWPSDMAVVGSPVGWA